MRITRNFQPSEYSGLENFLTQVSPHGATQTEGDGSVTVTVETDRLSFDQAEGLGLDGTLRGIEAAEPAEPVETFDAWACHDCAHLIANGETPVDLTEAETEAYFAAIGTDVLWGWGRSDEDEYIDFSWSACDVCGSTLGGARHGVHGWPL